MLLPCNYDLRRQKLNFSWKRRKNLILGFVIVTGWSLLCFAWAPSLNTWINWSSTWQGMNHLISVVFGKGRFAMWCGPCSALYCLFWLRADKLPVPGFQCPVSSAQCPVSSVHARWLTKHSQKHQVLVDYFSKMKVCKSKSRSGLDFEPMESCLRVASSHIRLSRCSELVPEKSLASFSQTLFHPS
jgi:hypothetical protein